MRDPMRSVSKPRPLPFLRGQPQPLISVCWYWETRRRGVLGCQSSPSGVGRWGQARWLQRKARDEGRRHGWEGTNGDMSPSWSQAQSCKLRTWGLGQGNHEFEASQGSIVSSRSTWTVELMYKRWAGMTQGERLPVWKSVDTRGLCLGCHSMNCGDLWSFLSRSACSIAILGH